MKTLPKNRPSSRDVAALIFQFFCMEEGCYGGVLHCAVSEGNLDAGSLKQTRGWVLDEINGATPPPAPEFDALASAFESPYENPERSGYPYGELGCKGDPHLALRIVDALLAMKMTARDKACCLGEDMWDDVSPLVYEGRGYPAPKEDDPGAARKRNLCDHRHPNHGALPGHDAILPVQESAMMTTIKDAASAPETIPPMEETGLMWWPLTEQALNGVQGAYLGVGIFRNGTDCYFDPLLWEQRDGPASKPYRRK